MKRRLMKKAVAVVLAAGLAVTCIGPLTARADAGSQDISGEGTASGTGNSPYSASGGDKLEGLTTPDTFHQGDAEQDIAVEAMVSGGAEIVYDINIAWGAMQFSYDYGSSWDSRNHVYTPTQGGSGSQTGGWVTTNKVDGINNKITVTNYSNFPMNASFSYDGNSGDVKLNENATDKPVIGIFSTNNSTFLDNDAALLADGNTGGAATMATLKNQIIEMYTNGLTTGQTYYVGNEATTGTNTNCALNVFFALSGKPGAGGPRTYSTVGQIKVKIVPCTTAIKKTK